MRCGGDAVETKDLALDVREDLGVGLSLEQLLAPGKGEEHGTGRSNDTMGKAWVRVVVARADARRGEGGEGGGGEGVGGAEAATRPEGGSVPMSR